MTRIELPSTKHTLQNGLDVVVHEDHHVPLVAVNLWYHVGSRHERPGRTGFAHLFEHLMFEGSAHHNASYFQPLERAGASVNGSTNTDRTNYWEVVPTNAIDLALWLESDRMGHLLPTLTAERFETQRGVVLNERRESYENRPYGMAMIALTAALYPDGHPYSWPTIGLANDIRAARLDDVHAFFRAYYHPRNASLAIAGDIEPARAHDLASHYFGELPAADAPAPVRPAPLSLRGDIRLVMEDRVELPRLYVAWHSPAMFAGGDAELDLAGDLLANGKTSRLYRSLVYERRIRARSRGSAALARAVQLLPARGHCRAGAPTGRPAGAHRGCDRGAGPSRAQRRGDGARRGAGRGHVPFAAPDAGRLRREV